MIRHILQLVTPAILVAILLFSFPARSILKGLKNIIIVLAWAAIGMIFPILLAVYISWLYDYNKFLQIKGMLGF